MKSRNQLSSLDPNRYSTDFPSRYKLPGPNGLALAPGPHCDAYVFAYLVVP